MLYYSGEFRVASYIRLSREDGKDGESQSIGNQRAIINRYIKENGLTLIDEYVDDGVSGTTFDRPGFKRMIADIESGRINMIVTKDYSRLGREYIGTGELLEKVFPNHRVRYVAINDAIDTFKDDGSNDMAPFKAVCNDFYPRDISKKVKSVFREKQRKGEYLCSNAPYGYKKDKLQKNHLVINDEVVHNVRKIFEMYLNGSSVYEIRKYFNDHKIQSPSGYAKKLVDIKEWNSVTILNILKNEAYIGRTVGNKRVKPSFKSKKRFIVPQEQRYITENTHESIITKEEFEKVQFILSQKSINRKHKHDYLLRGLLKCKTCGTTLEIGAKITRNGKNVKNPIPYITCRNSKKGMCNPQHLNYNKLENEVLEYLKNFLTIYQNNEYLNEIYQTYLECKNSKFLNYNRELENIDKKINKLNNDLDMIYNDKLNGLIGAEQYMRFHEAKINDKENLENRKFEIKNMISQINRKEETSNLDEIKKVFDDFLNLEEPDKMVLLKLIKRIEIDENKNVYIKFNFKKLNLFNEIMM